jgi:hypothetical protein
MPLEGRSRQMNEQSKGTSPEHRNGEGVETKLLRIAAKAAKEAGLKFVNLYYLMNEELLTDCYRRLRKKAAAGIDEVTKEEYGRNLADNLKELMGDCTGCRTDHKRCEESMYLKQEAIN